MNDQKFLQLYQRQQESGLTIIEFCSNEAIAPATFHYWKKRLGGQNRLPGFIPVVVNSPKRGAQDSLHQISGIPAPSAQDYPIVGGGFPNKTIVRIKSGVGLNMLKALTHLTE
jgi:hypothetical protein